jgi:hypothetical protein
VTEQPAAHLSISVFCSALSHPHPSIVVVLRTHSSIHLTSNNTRVYTMRSSVILASVGVASASAILPQAVPIRK